MLQTVCVTLLGEQCYVTINGDQVPKLEKVDYGLKIKEKKNQGADLVSVGIVLI